MTQQDEEEQHLLSEQCKGTLLSDGFHPYIGHDWDTWRTIHSLRTELAEAR
jgi:hypothetical protein